jgi:hypothetical protein
MEMLSADRSPTALEYTQTAGAERTWLYKTGGPLAVCGTGCTVRTFLVAQMYQ